MEKTGTVHRGSGHLATSVGLCSVVSLVPKGTSLSRLLDEDFFPMGFGVFGGGLKQGLSIDLALACVGCSFGLAIALTVGSWLLALTGLALAWALATLALA